MNEPPALPVHATVSPNLEIRKERSGIFELGKESDRVYCYRVITTKSLTFQA